MNIETNLEFPYNLNGKLLLTQNALSKYLKKYYNIKFEDWYIKNYLNEIIPTCSRDGCNNRVKFRGRKFDKYCSLSCNTKVANTSEAHKNSVSKSLRTEKAKLKMKERNDRRWSKIDSHVKQSQKAANSWNNKYIKAARILGLKNWYINNPEMAEEKRLKLSLLYKSKNSPLRKKISNSVKLAYLNDPTLVQRTTKHLGKIRNSKDEMLFEEYCIKNNIKYKKQFWLKNYVYDFYLEDFNSLIEIDGEYYHLTKIPVNKGLNLMQLSNINTDKIKNDLAINNNYDIYRIRKKDIKFECDWREFSYSFCNNIENKFVPFLWEHNKILIERDYIISLKINDKILLIDELLKFIRNFNFDYFIYTKNIDNLKKTIEIIRNKNITKFTRDAEYKKYFPNLYDVKNKYSHINKTTKEIFYNDELLKKVLKYRLGLNNSKIYQYKTKKGLLINSKETSNITKNDIIGGINSMYRSTPSLFRPSIAYKIYKKYTNEGETTYDPSAGFGGRLLGSFCANLNYIGTDPNTETFKNLNILADDLLELEKDKEIKLYNLQSEELEDIGQKVDFIFTSIPYFDKEIYCNEETQCYNRYKDYNIWLEKYLKKTLENCKNIIKDDKIIAINVCRELKDDLIKMGLEIELKLFGEDYIENNASHFSKSNIKTEPIILFKK